MLKRRRFEFSIILSIIFFVFAACTTSKEVTKAKEFLDAGMFDNAIIILNQEIQTDPKNAEAHMLLGVAQLGSGMSNSPELNTAMAMDNSLKSEASKRCYKVGQLLAKTDKTKANVALVKAREFDPSLDKDETFFFLTDVDTNLDNSSRTDAAKKYLTLFPSGPNTAESMFVVAESLEATDRNQAKASYTQIAAKFPGTEWARQANDRLTNWTDWKDMYVSSQQTWVDTGVSLTAGQKFDIEASGQWSFGPCCPAVGADGANGRFDPKIMYPSAPVGALLGKIGSDVFNVGENYSGNSPSSGKLSLSMNEAAGEFGNNSGGLNVHISYGSR